MTEKKPKAETDPVFRVISMTGWSRTAAQAFVSDRGDEAVMAARSADELYALPGKTLSPNDPRPPKESEAHGLLADGAAVLDDDLPKWDEPADKHHS